MWRNRQTRQIQVLVVAIPCGFKSLHPHHKSDIGFDTMSKQCPLFYLKRMITMLEEMALFFENRLSDYDEHMRRDIEGAKEF